MMTISKAKREANNKWDAANMTVLGCKVRKDKADQFKAACAAAGTSVNAVFLAAMDEFMERDAATASGAVPASPSGDPASTIPGRGMPGAAGGDVS